MAMTPHTTLAQQYGMLAVQDTEHRGKVVTGRPLMEFLQRVFLWVLGHWLMKKGLYLGYIEGAPWVIDQLGECLQMMGSNLIQRTGWPLDHVWVSQDDDSESDEDDD